MQTPVDKLSSKNDWLISSQFLTNYYFTPKAYSTLSVIGMSINIEHSEGVSWKRISKKVPNLRVVSVTEYLFHNLDRFCYFEEMLSSKPYQVLRELPSCLLLLGYRGRILHKLCGMSNIRSNSDQSTSCAQNLPKSVNWTLADFAENLNNWQVYFGIDLQCDEFRNVYIILIKKHIVQVFQLWIFNMNQFKLMSQVS